MPALHLRVLAPDVSRVQGDLQALQGFSLCLGVCELLRLLAKGQVVPLILARLLADAGLVLLKYDPRLPPFLPRAINLGKSSLELIPGHRRLPRIKQSHFEESPKWKFLNQAIPIPPTGVNKINHTSLKMRIGKGFAKNTCSFWKNIQKIFSVFNGRKYFRRSELSQPGILFVTD